MKLIKPIYIIASALLMWACFPEPLEIDIPLTEPKLVISSQFLSDTGVVVTVTRSFSALSDNYRPEKINLDFVMRVFALNALVTINHRQQTDTLNYLAPGLYGNFKTRFNTGDICHLYVYDSATHKEVWSQAVFLQKVYFDTVSARVTITPDDTTATIYYTFTDIEGLNYYMTTYYKIEENRNPVLFDDLLNNDLFSDIFSNPANLNQVNSMLNNIGKVGTVGLETKLYCDTGFSSVNFTDSFIVKHSKLDDSLAVAMANISPEYHYYLYLRSKAGTLYSQIMSEPINMNTNIEEGLGMFTTHSLDIRYIFLAQQPVFHKNTIIVKKNINRKK